MSQQATVPGKKYGPLDLLGWWGDAHFGGNEDTVDGVPEIAAAVDNNKSEGQLFWGNYPPLDVSYSATLVANDGSGKTKFTVNGTSVSYSPCGTVNVKKVVLYVGAEAGTKCCWENVTATFTPSSGNAWTSPAVNSLCADALGSGSDADPQSTVITPPALTGGATYINVTVSGTIHLKVDDGTYPSATNTYAIALASRN